MRFGIYIKFFVLLILLLTTEELAAQSGYTVSPVTSKEGPGGTSMICEFTVAVPQGGEELKDVHIKPFDGERLDRPLCPGKCTYPPDWDTPELESDGFHFYALDAAGIQPGAKFTFSFKYEKGKNSILFKRPAKWYLTKNGQKKFESGDLLGAGEKGLASNGKPFRLPVKYIEAGVNPGSSSAIGQTFIMDLGTTESGYAYQTFLSQVRLATNTPDAAGQAIEIDTTMPPPRDWGLFLRNGRGAFRQQDGRAQYEILIPADPDLVGRQFFVVSAIDLDSDGLFDLYTTPEKVLITEY